MTRFIPDKNLVVSLMADFDGKKISIFFRGYNIEPNKIHSSENESLVKEELIWRLTIS